jgi:hypothetical protein
LLSRKFETPYVVSYGNELFFNGLLGVVPAWHAISFSNKPKPVRSIPQDWSVMQGVSEQWDWTNNAIYGHSTNGGAILASTRQYGDITMSAIASTTNRDACLAFRMQDANDGYIVLFVPDGTPWAADNGSHVSLVKQISGEEESYLAMFKRRGLAQSAKITVTARGPQIEVFLNDVSIIKVKDTTYPSGFIGLRVYGDTVKPCDSTFSNLTFY